MNLKFSKPRSFLDKIKTFFTGDNVSEYLEDIEQCLIEADIDLAVVEQTVEMIKKNRIKSFEEARLFLKKEFAQKLADPGGHFERNGLYVIILVGINGGGKTTAASKLARYYKDKGKKVMMVAADTFRAAAIEQLEMWGKRLGVPVIKGDENGDPASVVFDGITEAKKSGADVLLVDTAGRLHTKTNLMQEITKIKKVILKEIPAGAMDIFIIVDTNTGKNAYIQAREFNEALGLTGVILTKFDSSAKGGSIIHIKENLGIPVKFLTFGEQVEDMEEFNAQRFVNEMFD
jgi:fused signal recognition particle receptor